MLAESGAADGDVPTWDAGTGLWVPIAPGAGGAIALDDLTDVDTDGQTNGSFLRYNGTLWVPATAALDDLSDVTTSGQTTGDVLTYNGTNWVPDAVSATNGIPPGGTTGQVLAKDTDTDYDASWQDIEALGEVWVQVTDDPLTSLTNVTTSGATWSVNTYAQSVSTTTSFRNARHSTVVDAGPIAGLIVECEIEVQSDFGGSTATGDIVGVGWTTPTGTFDSNGFAFWLRGRASSQTARVIDNTSSQTQVLQTQITDGWHKLRLLRNAQAATAYLDGTLVAGLGLLDNEIPAGGSPVVFNYGTTTSRFRNFKAWKLAAPMGPPVPA
jgi:hypothetical protein